MHPAWWFDLLTTEPLEFASLNRFEGTVAELVARMFDPAATIADLPGCARCGTGRWSSRASQTSTMPGPSSTPARTPSSSRTTGAASSTGPPTPLEALAVVVDAVGDRAEVYVDGGILSGSDVVAAVALGARAALVGRAYLYGLMAGGERGVQRAADILLQEVAIDAGAPGRDAGRRTFARDHVRLRGA